MPNILLLLFVLPVLEDTIDESYGVAVVFNEDDERESRGRGKETSVAHDDDDIPEDDDNEGVEADYDEVLTSGVCVLQYSISACTLVCMYVITAVSWLLYAVLYRI